MIVCKIKINNYLLLLLLKIFSPILKYFNHSLIITKKFSPIIKTENVSI